VGPRLLALYRREPKRGVKGETPSVPPYLRHIGPYLAGIPLRRMQVGDETALLLCGPPDAPPAAFSLTLDGYTWFEGTFAGRLGCALFPLTVPERPGRHRVSIRLEDKAAELGEVVIKERVATLTPVEAGELTSTPFVWEGGIRLVGYQLTVGRGLKPLPTAPIAYRPGEEMRITMRWQSGEPTSTRLVFFIHLLGEVYNAEQGNFLWGQRDAEPLDGAYPSTAWQPGRKWEETWTVPIHPNAPPGVYQVEIGWYDPATGERLRLVEPKDLAGADYAILTTVQIVAER